MPISYVMGDPLLTRCQTLAIGHNRRAREEVDVFQNAIRQKYPAAYSTYSRLCQKDRLQSGNVWISHETTPKLAFLVVRESSVGATRARYVDAVALQISRDYQLLGIQSLAIAPLGRPEEWAEHREILSRWLGQAPFPVVIYDAYQPGVRAEEAD